MANPTVKYPAPITKYSELRTLGETIVASMTGNLSFPTPSPTLAIIQTAVDALTAAITAWGTKGSRGSHQDLVNLRVSATNLRNLLLMETAYVMNKVDLNADPLTQKAFILSSGFEVRSTRAPQGLLPAPQNVHQLIQKKLSPYTPKISWKKPLGLTSLQNVKLYNIFRSATNNFSTAVIIGTPTKTTFTDMNAPKGTTQYYFVAGVNTNGLGVASAGVTVLIPN